MTDFKLPGPTVSVNWLATHLDHPKIIILDASIKPATIYPSNDEIFQIPKARYFDFDKEICDKSSMFPHMMPTPELFTQKVQSLGVYSDSIIVVYDCFGIYSSPRAWWMFKAMGHKQVAVLDGGLPAWINASMLCETRRASEISTSLGNFVAEPCLDLFCDSTQVLEALSNQHCKVIEWGASLKLPVIR